MLLMQSRQGLRAPLATVAVTAVVGTAVIGGTAFAAGTIPGPDGVINGCFNTSKGGLRLVNSGEACKVGEKAIG